MICPDNFKHGGAPHEDRHEDRHDGSRDVSRDDALLDFPSLPS